MNSGPSVALQTPVIWEEESKSTAFSTNSPPARLDQAKAAFKAMGADLQQFYLVTGQYDIVVISEAPDDETVAKVALAVSSGGAIRTETLRAFTEDEYRKIIAGLP